MTIRHLNIFLTVAETGKMSLAASKLYISQPAVSKAIAELEEHYGVKLFERLSQKLYITRDGERLFEFARHILDSFQAMEHAMMLGGQEYLRIGCSVSVGTALIHELLDKAYAALNPCDVSVTIDNTSAIEQMVLNNQVDLGFVEGISDHRDLCVHPVCTDTLLLVCGKNHPLAHKQTVNMTDLINEPMISREKGSTERNQFEKLACEKGIELRRTWTSTNTEAIKNAVLAGRGIAVLSEMTIRKELQDGELIALPLEKMPIVRTVDLIYHRQKFISHSMQAMINTCLENLQAEKSAPLH